MNKPKVWIVKEQMIRGETQPIPMDFSPAMQFGEIEFITAFDMPMYPRGSVQDAWNEDVASFVRRYDEKNDYIITTGQPMAIFCVGWVLGMERKAPRFLIWRREENKYRVVHFDVSWIATVGE
jgi:hypothetical protein